MGAALATGLPTSVKAKQTADASQAGKLATAVGN
jgi:hypothetical protein